MNQDWRAWHDAYDDPQSPLSRRLRVVQDQIAALLDAAPPGPLRVISMCAGQGRDLIGVLGTHPRAPEVTARGWWNSTRTTPLWRARQPPGRACRGRGGGG